MRILLAAIMVGFVAVALAFGFAPRRDVVASLSIAAPPARVWAILTDTAAYPAWNPDMALTGALIPGRTIEHRQGEMVFHPVIVTVSPPTELSWLGHLGPPRFFDALHSFHLTPEPGGTRFTQTEHMRGVLLWLWDAGQLLPSFQAMNAALKARAELHP